MSIWHARVMHVRFVMILLMCCQAFAADPWYDEVAKDLTPLKPVGMVFGADQAAVQGGIFEIMPGGMFTPITIPDFGHGQLLGMEQRSRTKPPNYWDHHWKVQNQVAWKSGQVLYVTGWTRSLVGGMTGTWRFNLDVRGNGINWGPVFSAQDKWKRIHAFRELTEDAAPGDAKFLVSFGYEGNEAIQVAGLQAWLLPAGTDPKQLPQEYTSTDYAGRAADAPWRKAAEERIVALRTAPIVVSVVDASGAVVPGAQVQVTQKRQAFTWGNEVYPYYLPGIRAQSFGYHGPLSDRLTDADRAKHAELLPRYVNDVTWSASWYGWKPGYAELNRSIYVAQAAWMRQAGVQGSGVPIYRPPYLDPEAIALLGRGDKAGFMSLAESFLTDYAAVGKDVVREAYIANEWDIAGTMKAVAGEEFIGWQFATLRRLMPQTSLGFNDPGPGSDYAKRITAAKNAGVKLDHVGFQWHMDPPGVAPEDGFRQLSEYSDLGGGCAMHISEFDVAVPDPKDPRFQSWQTDYLRDMLIMAYSHPKVSKFAYWGFWEPVIWDSRAKNGIAFFTADWQETAIGRTWRELVRGKWWTDAKGASDAQGGFTARAHLGTLQVSATAGGRQGQAEVVANKAGEPVRVTIRLAP